MIRTILIILSLLSLTFAGGFQGTVTSSLGDQVGGAHIIGKRGNTVVVDTFANDAGEYLLNWSTVGIAGGIDFNLPSTQLTGLGNSITSNGRVYPFLNGSPSKVAYRVYDLSGREVTNSPVYAQGKYFLQVFNKTNGKILGVESFIYLDGNGLEVQFKADLHTTNNLAKAMEDTDSLIVEYTGSGMLLERYAEAVVIPESYETRDIVLERTLQSIVLEFSGIPENPTIDETYVIIINADSPDYDNHITEVDVFHISGDSIHYEFNGVDTLLIFPHTQGDHEFHVLANDLHSHRGRNIDLSVESQTHRVQTLDFFYALDEPYPGLEIYLRDKMAITDVNGVATLEFPTTSPAFTIQDSIEIYHPTNDSTFYNMRLPVDAQVDTQIVQTYTDKHGPSYWAEWSWVNQWNRESNLSSTNLMPNFQFRKFGTLENGQADTIRVYCPDYTSPNGLEYKPIIAQEIDNLNNGLDDRAGAGRQARVHYFLTNNTLEDSLHANNSGIMLHFEGTHNYDEIDTESNWSEDLFYIRNTDAFISTGIYDTELGHRLLRRLFYHEAIQHGNGLVGHSPYNPHQGGGEDVQENMNSGAHDLKEHEIDGLFTRMHYEPSHIRHFQGYEQFWELHHLEQD